jgi:hypothetical protein
MSKDTATKPARKRSLAPASGVGKWIMGILAVVAVVAAAKFAMSSLGTPHALDAAETQIFVDSETGQSFTAKLTVGMTFPVKSPFTGRQTGFPAELCYWTKDGQIKTDPTPVALNSYLGKSGPTFCPDCGRLVVPHNPMPRPGAHPPPTLEQYKATHPNFVDN